MVPLGSASFARSSAVSKWALLFGVKREELRRPVKSGIGSEGKWRCTGLGCHRGDKGEMKRVSECEVNDVSVVSEFSLQLL